MAPHIPERRRAARISCEIPILLRCGGRTVESVSADLSRMGTRIRIPFEALGLSRDVPMSDLSREAMGLLGEMLVIELHYIQLGDLVRRTAKPVRFARTKPGQDYVEIGLELRAPLTDLETEFLGLPLPPLFEDIEVPVPAHTSSENTAPETLTVLLCAEDDETTPPLHAVPTYLGAGGAKVDLGAVDALPLLVERPGAAGVMAALSARYGAEPRSVILMQHGPVWSGPVRLQAVDTRSCDGRVLLEVAFKRPISDGARAQLGL